MIRPARPARQSLIGGLSGLMIRAGPIQGVLEALVTRPSPPQTSRRTRLDGIAIHLRHSTASWSVR
ncbi:hypothetical protein C8039_00900 [Halogeometricum sp. wsp3]|nr:hypothetical protein C8039_00900 [Halogeometricum sp. wsp3]